MRTYSAVTCLLLGSALSAQGTGLSLTNRVDGFVEIPYSAALVPQGGITVEAWCTYDDSNIPQAWTWPTVARQNQTAGQESWFLRVQAANTNTKSIRFLVQTASGTVTVDWGFAPGQLTTWTHLAATYDGAMAHLFVNGTEVASSVGTGRPLLDQGGTLRIGKGSDAGGPIEVWNGELDEVRLWPFARTAAEIQSTMGMELLSVPGQVSTWNFNNNYDDTSNLQNGTATGTVPFASNTLNLSPMPGFLGVTYGASTQGCLGPIETAASSLPTVGNADFSVVCSRVPPNGVAIGFLGFASQTPPITLAGVDVLVDPTNAQWTPLSADVLGTVRYPLPIPASVAPGLSFAVQIGARDACGPQGWTASNALGSGTL